MKYFPFPSFRPRQKEAIEFVLDSFANGKRVVFLESPTGAGKSAIAYTVAKHFDKAYYLTATKILQNQLINDFGHDKSLATIKGRNAYECKLWPKMIRKAKEDGDAIRSTLIAELSRPEFKFNCNVGVCKIIKKVAKMGECVPNEFPGALINGMPSCAYWYANFRARAAQMCVMNFDSFLYQTVFTDAFPKRNFMCLDEAHNTEGKLLDFVSITISDRDLDIILEERKTPEEYAKYFDEIDLMGRVRLLAATASANDKIKKLERLESMLTRLALLREVDNDKWVCNFTKKRHRMIELKPLFIRKYANELLFSKADKILLMSATILSHRTMVDALGLDENEVASYKMPSVFPVENRPIYFEPCGSLSYKNKVRTYPRLVETVDRICEKYPDNKGIIHTHNFEIANLLIDACDSSDRFLFQKDFVSKDEMLEEHSQYENSVIIAPAMHEGLNLTDNDSRFQIICKVPYPNQNANPQLKKRVEISWNYYVWLTALKICQSYGRSVRHDKDWAHTYIVDEDFGRFFSMAANILPEWFLEAIQI